MTSALMAAAIDERLQTAALLSAAFMGSLAISALLWRWLGARMRRERWLRPNYRGRPVVGVGGLLVIASTAAAIALAAVLLAAGLIGAGNEIVGALGRGISLARSAEATVWAAAIAAFALLFGFGWLGYHDDTSGIGGEPDTREAAGFRGHLYLSWEQRRLTSGAQKAVGGLIVAVAAVQIALWGDPSGSWDARGEHVGGPVGAVLVVLGLQVEPVGMWSAVELARAALIVALSANLLNLTDRAPGRATKVVLAWWLVGLVPVTITAASWPDRFGFGLGGEAAIWAVCAAAAAGASAGLLRSELAEEHMLGDSGVNPVGAVLGMATVVAYSGAVEWVVLAVLALANLASERWSFSKVIDTVPPLRWLDRLGSPYRR